MLTENTKGRITYYEDAVGNEYVKMPEMMQLTRCHQTSLIQWFRDHSAAPRVVYQGEEYYDISNLPAIIRELNPAQGKALIEWFQS